MTETVYVGDGVWDFRAATKLGIPFIEVGRVCPVVRHNRGCEIERDFFNLRSLMTKANSECFQLAPSGWVPNNAKHPVIIHHGVALNAPDRAAEMEALFRKHHWPAQWRNGIYPFHHYHSTAHEVLGVAAGQAQVILGGESGRTVALKAGDVVILPAGTGHCRVSASTDFLVIGGYPEGQDWNTRRDALSPKELSAMLALSYPASDPVTGESP